MSLRTASIEVSLQRLSILRIEHPQANPLTLACTLRAGETLPSGLNITAEIHTSRNVAAETTPLASSSVTVAADAISFDVSFTSAQLNQTVTPDSTRALWLVVYGVGDADQLYTLAAADLLLGWHAISTLTADPPATSILVEKGGVAWASGRSYVSGTVVTVGATAYVCTTDNTSTTDDEPGVGAEWESFWVVLSGGGGGSTNIAAVPSPTNVVITSDTGDDATIPAADGTNAGLMLPAQVTKLAGVATGATANSSDAALLARGNHTGTQAISTIANLQTSLDGKADLVGGKLNTYQLPDLAISQYLGTAANQSAMLALVGQRGDWCTRTDDGKVYVVTGEPSSTLGNWTSLSYPTAPVLSVAGRTGAITLNSGDISGLGTLATQSGTFSGSSSGTNTGDVTLAASISTVFTLSGQQIGVVTDPVADRILFFDQSSASMAYATIGNGLLMTGTDLAVSLTSPGPIGGTAPGEGTFNQLNARTSLEVQATTGAGGPLRVWNTGTDTPTNWERGFLRWTANVFQIGTEFSGSGTAKPIHIQTAGVTRVSIGTSGLIGVNGAATPANTPLSVKAINPGGNHVVVRVENAINTSSIVEIGGTTSNNGFINIISSSAGTVDLQAGNSQFPGAVGIGRGTGGSLTSARVHIRGSGTGATETLRVENSAGTARFTVRDDGAFAFAGGIVAVADTGWTDFTNLTTDKTCNANATTVEELADILGTLIVALKNKGIIAN